MTDTATLTAGAELDRLIAEKVLGWEWYTPATDPRPQVPRRMLIDPNNWPDPESCPLEPARGDEPLMLGWLVPRFSTDIAAAWLLVDHLRANGFDAFSLAIDTEIPDQAWRAMFSDGNRAYGHATTAPLAICRAALATDGIL